MPTVALHPQADFGERKSTERPRLHFLDGIRGLAAFLVVLHHMWQHSFLRVNNAAFPLWFRGLSILKEGHYLVAVFIVLSGFCLMLPVAQASGVMKGGAADYIKRRARRILPPYYASLAFAVALIALAPATREDTGTIYDAYQRSDMTGALVAHVLVLHNLFPNWAYRFDAPLWSVATEWQIYFVFPLALLPVWRRWGSVAPILIGLALGFLSAGTVMKEACFWYIDLFAMGMAASSVCFAPQSPKRSASGHGRVYGARSPSPPSS